MRERAGGQSARFLQSEKTMTISKINSVSSGFELLETTERAQMAVMILDPEGKSSEKLNTHEKSDQVLLVVEGEVVAEVDGRQRTMRKGEACIVPAGTPHRFENVSAQRAVTFNVYSPPEYSSE